MEAERVRLYAMCDEQAESLNAKSYTDFCEYWTTGKPLTPGAAVVLALFPDLDAAVAEELGRLVDVWPQNPTDDPKRSVQIYRGMLTGEWYDSGGNDTRVQWDFDANGFTDFLAGPNYRVIPLADPAAVCAAIKAVRERIAQ